MIFTAFLFFCSLVVLSQLLAGAPLLALVDIPSFACVVLCTFLFVLSSGRFSLFVRGMISIFRYEPEKPHPDNREIARFFQELFWFEIVLFALNATWGGVICCAYSFDPMNIGAGVAVICLSLFYSFAIACFLFLPISLRFRTISFSLPQQDQLKPKPNEGVPSL